MDGIGCMPERILAGLGQKGIRELYRGTVLPPCLALGLQSGAVPFSRFRLDLRILLLGPPPLAFDGVLRKHGKTGHGNDQRG